MKKIVKKNYKILIGIVIGIIISTTIVYSEENILTGEDISYDNKTSGEETVQGAIDELYEKANKSKAPKPNNTNIVAVYYYDETKGSEDFCVTGDEETCKINTCYLNKIEGSCPPGTIIEYKVNDNDIVRFHVLKDNGDKMMLQSQQDTVTKTAWYTTENDYIENNKCDTCTVTKGPQTILPKLEEETKNWNNVNNLTYSIGDNNTTLGYSNCHGSDNCDSKSYSLEKLNVKARMITILEAAEMGCNYRNENSCPIWMSNYLFSSTKYNGTINGICSAYYTMNTSANDSKLQYALSISSLGKGSSTFAADAHCGARAVVEINK